MSPSFRVVLAVVSLVSVLAMRRIASGAAAASSEVDIKIDNFSMAPQTVTCLPTPRCAGRTATDIPHTVVSEDGSFKSKVLDTDDRFAYTFSKPGTYKYFCSIHPKMTGTVVVR